jgi:cyclic-di-GMP-binding protein
MPVLQARPSLRVGCSTDSPRVQPVDRALPSDEFRRVGVELLDRADFGGFLEVVNLVADDAVGLGVKNHDGFFALVEIFLFRADGDVAGLFFRLGFFLGGAAGGRGGTGLLGGAHGLLALGKINAGTLLGNFPLADGGLVLGDHVGAAGGEGCGPGGDGDDDAWINARECKREADCDSGQTPENSRIFTRREVFTGCCENRKTRRRRRHLDYSRVHAALAIPDGTLHASKKTMEKFRACAPGRTRVITGPMPSFDVVSEVDRMEIKNAVDQSLRELASRFDFKGIGTTITLDPKSGSILLSCAESARLGALREIVTGKLAKRGVDLRNIDQKEPEISPLGHSRQELAVKQGLDGDKAKEISRAVKNLGLKVQSSLQDRHLRVSGNKRDDLQAVITSLRAADFGVGLAFKNFRD